MITLLLAAASLLVLSGCPPPRPDSPPVGGSGSTVSRPDAQADFEAAVVLYEAGVFEEAVRSFQLFLAQHAGDPLALRAEFYLGRAQAAAGDTLGAMRLFDGLHEAPESDEAWRAAALYRAFVSSLRGEAAWGRAVLVEQAGTDAGFSLRNRYVIAGDEAPLAVLVAEARVDLGQPEAAISALQAALDAGPTEELSTWALDRAVGLAAELDLAALRRLARSEDRLAVAVATPPLVDEAVASGDIEEAQRVFEDGEAAMLGVGLLEQAASLRASMVDEGVAAPPTVGMLLSLSGPNRRAARAALGAALLAQRAFEAREPRSVLVIEDTEDSARGARDGVRALVASGAAVIIGPIVPELADAARAEAEALGVPIVTLSTEAFTRSVGDSGRWMADPGTEALAIVEAANARGLRRLAVVRDAGSVPYFDAFADAAAAAAAARGIAITIETTVAEDPDDGRVLQQRAAEVAETIARSDADGLVLATTADEAAAISAYLASQDVWPSPDGGTRSASGRRQISYLGHSFLVDATVLMNSSRYLEGAVFASWFDVPTATGAARSFADRFAWTYGRDPGLVEAFAFDATSWAIETVAASWPNGSAALAVAMRPASTSTAPALCPPLAASRCLFGADLTVDDVGNPRVEPSLLTVRDGSFTPLDR